MKRSDLYLLLVTFVLGSAFFVGVRYDNVMLYWGSASRWSPCSR